MGPPPAKNPNPPKFDSNPPPTPPDPIPQQQEELPQQQQQQQQQVQQNPLTNSQQQQEQPQQQLQPTHSSSSHHADDSGLGDAQENPNSTSDDPLAPTAVPAPELSTTAAEEAIVAGIPYTIPPWSAPPCHPFSLEVLKDGTIIDQLDVSGKGAFMFGRVDLCDFVLEHPTISRFHAVLQFNGNGDAFLYDLGSTHGTFVNKAQVKKKVYLELHVGDVIRFGHSSRLYILQGPPELMPLERDLKQLRDAKIREKMQDREASLLRASVEASLADGISWGMAEDAIEEIGEEDADEVTWQTYKGQLTEKQEKTREKIIKRLEKVANMKKEIDAIRVKDISQGGLTQGQQTQIARNEQRISQIMEELENLEETLNESIQESIGARAGKVVYGKKKGTTEDEDETLSDDDEFYDRTKKKPATHKAGEQQSIETADTLLDKKEAIIKEMEEKTKFLTNEKSKVEPKVDGENENGDALDAYMTGVSTQIVLDVTIRLQTELSSLQSELDRIQYLLKIADPMGEASQRRNSKPQVMKSKPPDTSISDKTKILPKEKKKSTLSDKSVNASSLDEPLTTEIIKPQADDNKVSDDIQTEVPAYTVTKPLWLGAIQDMEIKEKHEVPLNLHESDGFVDYKDRKKVLIPVEETQTVESMIEDAAPGLIIRKRKLPEKSSGSDDKASGSITSYVAENTAVDAVALLLKHKRGYFASEVEEGDENHVKQSGGQSRKENSDAKRMLGPERPAFLESSPESETWVPPQGQSGDGRTSLNDRYGY